MIFDQIDPDYQPLLASLPQSDDLQARRKWLLSVCGAASPEGAAVEVKEWSINSPDPQGEVLGLRVFTPGGPSPMPVLLYCHGGGFAINDITINDVVCRDFAAAAECVVVAVDYRLSPAHRYPAAFDDCYAALLWVVEFADLLGIDPARLVVGGGSAGGALAAAVAIAARDRGGPSIRLLHLVNPILDDRMDTVSARSFTNTPMLNREAVGSTWARYLPETLKSADPLACPGRLENFEGLPPAYIEVAQRDPLRDEGLAFARRLLDSDIPVELHLHPGTFHGSELFEGSDISRQGRAIRSAALRRAFRV